jgi:hypothetical protein
MRRTSRWVLVALPLAAAVAVGPAASAPDQFLPDLPPSPAPVAADRPADAAVVKLIKDLGDEDYKVREKAGRDLAALGEKALPELRAALQAADNPEVQRRLAVLVRKLDHDRLVSPKTVTLSAKDTTIQAALDEISKQTGYKIEYGGGGGRRVKGGPAGGDDEPKHTFEFDKTPFWVAVDKVATAAGCVVFSDYDDETIRVYNQDSVNPYVAYAGPFRFLATQLYSNRSVQLSGVSRRGGGPYRQDNMNLSFQIQSEPKCPMLGVTRTEVVTALDEFGGSLVPPKDPNNRSEYYNNSRMRGHNTYGNLNLSRSDRNATTIKTLKAKVGILLLTGTTPEITVTDPLKVKTKTFTGRSVELEYGALTEDANNKGHYVLDVTLKKLGQSDPNRPDYNWADNIWQRIELIDEHGERYRTFGPNNFNNNGTVVQLTVAYGPEDRRGNRPPLKLGAPVKVVVNEWLSVTHEVIFEFKDIPLP